MGGRFCSLLQLYKSLVEMMYIRRRNWMKTKNKKKVFAGNWSHFSPKLGEDIKIKRSSPQFAIIFGRKFVGSLDLLVFFLCDLPALNSRWEDA